MLAQIEYLVRERRHLGLSVILSSQDPPSVPHSVLDELDGVGVFRMDAVRWLTTLGKNIGAFAGASLSWFQKLQREELLLWSRRLWTEGPGGPDGTSLLRLRARPRLSQHGGATQTATGRAGLW